MKKYRLTAKATISIYTEIEAETLESAINIAEERDLMFISKNGVDTEQETWMCDELDGVPFEIESREYLYESKFTSKHAELEKIKENAISKIDEAIESVQGIVDGIHSIFDYESDRSRYKDLKMKSMKTVISLTELTDQFR